MRNTRVIDVRMHRSARFLDRRIGLDNEFVVWIASIRGGAGGFCVAAWLACGISGNRPACMCIYYNVEAEEKQCHGRNHKLQPSCRDRVVPRPIAPAGAWQDRTGRADRTPRRGWGGRWKARGVGKE